ncbi:MAG: (2Fe-2S)-binding protein [Spirochaetaceae bacterium]|nr:MAG: (2Fe-2S)-binding protein [Spirochaetaceae bacterium]
MRKIRLRINGDLYERDVRESKTLLHFLREDVGLTGTKEGCGAGECGACTVFMNGETVNSCLVLAVEADGADLQTIEGETAEDGSLSAVQQAFARHHAVQCGFCTPGMIMTVKDLLQRKPKPTREEVIHGIESNFCRCTGYQQIVEAVLDVTGQLPDSEKEGLKYV